MNLFVLRYLVRRHNTFHQAHRYIVADDVIRGCVPVALQKGKVPKISYHGRRMPHVLPHKSHNGNQGWFVATVT